MTTADPIDSARHHMAANASHSMSATGYDGANGGFAPAGATTPLPHIDDVLALPHDIDRNHPMKHLLDLAESALAESEMSRDFSKPAQALRDYVRTSVIVVQIIPSHNDYVELKSSRTDWNQRHSQLLKRISQQSDVYDKIKRDIIADNKRTGIQSKSIRQKRTGVDSSPLPSPITTGASVSTRQRPANGLSHSHMNGSAGKTKPAVHPKPQSLIGNAIRSGHARALSAAPTTLDLAARFANLRGPQSLQGQDPRIKTHQIIPLKPAGPREMPPPQQPKVSADSSIPTLPKMPDAIYSPVRGNLSGEAARLPSSAPRGLFGRTGSSVSSIGSPSISQQPPSSDYFSTQSQSYSRHGNNGTSGMPEYSFRIPGGDTITPERLLEAMKAKGSVLIIDLRVREDFDEGHIMSSSTICIEPSILVRENISAEEISDSLVLSPNQEQLQFERRTSYELVVLYDQNSMQISQSPRDSDEIAMASMYRALVHLSYGQELRNPPKLLEGGLDAWIDLLGPASLQSTAVPRTRRLSSIPSSHGPFQRKPSQYIGKPLKPDVVKVWQEAVANEEKETETATEQAYHRSTESFLRRFPSLSQQESMLSPVATEQRGPSYGSSHQVDLYTDLPSPPIRPAPALPRPSYSGLSQMVDDHTYDDTSIAMNTQGSRRFYTGLNNPHNWCYANSTLQSLLASPDFGRELSNSKWVNKYQVPRKEDENIDQPQLMIKIISNLFHWMTTGKFQVMKAQTLMDYSRSLCQHAQSDAQFGGPGQQDAQEFMSFILDQLHDETNCRRNRQGNAAQPNTKRQSLLRAAVDYWRSYLETNQSIVDQYWRGLEVSTVECLQCYNKTYTFSTSDLFLAPVGLDRDITLEQSLQQHAAPNPIDDFVCEICKCKTKAQQMTSFARMPRLLCVSFRRFQQDYSTGEFKKSTYRVTWDFNNVDFSPYFVKATTSDQVDDKAFSGPFQYECYAVIIHTGSRIDNGHYYAYVRDSTSHDPYAWFRCNDSTATKVRIGSGDPGDKQREVFKYEKDHVPYLAFFKRKPIS